MRPFSSVIMSTTVASILTSISGDEESVSEWAFWNASLLLDRSMFDIVNRSSPVRRSPTG